MTLNCPPKSKPADKCPPHTPTSFDGIAASNTLCECVHWAKLFLLRSTSVIGSKGVLMRRGLHALVCLLFLNLFSISQDTPVIQSAPAAAPASTNPAPAKPRL